MEDPEYDFEAAAEVAYENNSPTLQEKFSEEDVLQILLVQNDYYDTNIKECNFH